MRSRSTEKDIERDPTRCVARLPSGSYSSYDRRCELKATVERDGRPYCHHHDPVVKEARVQARIQKGKDELERLVRMQERQQQREMLIGQLIHAAMASPCIGADSDTCPHCIAVKLGA